MEGPLSRALEEAFRFANLLSGSNDRVGAGIRLETVVGDSWYAEANWADSGRIRSSGSESKLDAVLELIDLLEAELERVKRGGQANV